MIDASIVTALAALGGSLVGGVSSFATTYFTQTHHGRRDRSARDIENRQALYGEFIDQAAALFLDSVDKTLDGPDGLIGIGAVMGRIKLISSEPVIQASETVMREIIASYNRPPFHRRELVAETRETFTNPIAVFTDACRNERASLLSRL